MKRKRARGDGFFAAADTKASQPRGRLLGQETGYSCVAACCRMLLLDYVAGAEDDYLVSESFLRAALATDFKGTAIVRIPEVLREKGMPITYHYRKDLTIDDLRESVESFPAIAMVRAKGDDDFHALIVEGVTDTSVNIRDPLPEGTGSAYSLSLALFLSAWINEKTGCGHAVAVLK
jgi:hypothetical protein